MGYTTNDNCVRIDLFTETGRWYGTGWADMYGCYHELSAFEALRLAIGRNEDKGWPLRMTLESWLAEGGIVVCLEPWHQCAHPIILSQRTLDLANEEMAEKEPK